MKHLLLILFLPMIFNISLMGQDKSEQDRQKDILDCLNYQTIKSTFDFHGKRVAFLKAMQGRSKAQKKNILIG